MVPFKGRAVKFHGCNPLQFYLIPDDIFHPSKSKVHHPSSKGINLAFVQNHHAFLTIQRAEVITNGTPIQVLDAEKYVFFRSLGGIGLFWLPYDIWGAER